MTIGDLVDLHGTRYRVGARRRVGQVVLVRLDAVAKRTRPQHVLGPEAHLQKMCREDKTRRGDKGKKGRATSHEP